MPFHQDQLAGLKDFLDEEGAGAKEKEILNAFPRSRFLFKTVSDRRALLLLFTSQGRFHAFSQKNKKIAVALLCMRRDARLHLFIFLHKKLSAGKKSTKMGDNDNEWAAAFVLS